MRKGARNWTGLLRCGTSDMRISLRFIIPLALALAAIAYAVVPLVDNFTLKWFVRDLDIRTKLIATAVQESDQLGSRSERPALLLHHLLLAGARDEASMAAEQLGGEAMRAHAFDQAARAFATALELRKTGAGGVPPWHEARLLMLRGDALLAASDPEAIAVLVAAEQCAAAAADPRLTLPRRDAREYHGAARRRRV